MSTVTVYMLSPLCDLWYKLWVVLQKFLGEQRLEFIAYASSLGFNYEHLRIDPYLFMTYSQTTVAEWPVGKYFLGRFYAPDM